MIAMTTEIQVNTEMNSAEVLVFLAPLLIALSKVVEDTVSGLNDDTFSVAQLTPNHIAQLGEFCCLFSSPFG